MNKQYEIEIIKGDITNISVDAIVNAANSSLMGGGGVDGAIHRAGGNSILAECRKIISKQGRCNTGEAVITSAGNLPAKYVIHTVGPVWYKGQNHETEKLANCYTNSLKLAVENVVSSIAFPNISTGVYHFPKQLAASIAIESVLGFCEKYNCPDKIYFVCFDEDNFHFLKDYYNNKFSGIENVR